MNCCRNIKDWLLPAVLSLVVLLQACGTGASKKVKEPDVKWSTRLADAVMKRNDSLVIYNNPSSIRWQYDVAMLGQAIGQLDNEHSVYFQYFRNYFDHFIDSEGEIHTYELQAYDLDDVFPANGLLTLYEKTGEEKYLLAVHEIITQFNGQPRTKSGAFCHKKIYDGQLWLNSAYMYGPFLARYANMFNQPQWFDTICFQLKNIYEHTIDTSDGLMVHAWDETRTQKWASAETGKSPNKWGRGMGWYLMALVDVLQFLPADHPEKAELSAMLEHLSEALLKVRDKETGLWYQILDRGNEPYNYIETSCSAMIIYAYAKASTLGMLPPKYHDVAREAFLSLTNRFVKTGSDQLPTLTNISGPAGLGIKAHRDGSFEYYINQKQIDNEPKGIAPLIMAAIELNL
ncbi:MAG: glycoside hydrolase family 88 protein [Prolixibacteraceae bacterium]|nr:glycoside hydrolase family 88 protein [Prolixibacteraceae bacterium]